MAASRHAALPCRIALAQPSASLYGPPPKNRRSRFAPVTLAARGHSTMPAFAHSRHTSVSSITPRVLQAAAVAITLATATGCAGWLPWGSSQATEKQIAKYGYTADQRIAALQKEAAEAHEAGTTAEVRFSQGLIQTLLEEHDPRVRCSILEIAADFDTPAANAICEGGLRDPDTRVRMTACDVCGRRGKEAIPLLAACMETDEEIDVRLRAVRALGETGDTAAVATLAIALEDPDPAVQYRAVASLKELTGRDLGNDVNVWREWVADPEARASEPTMAETIRQIF